MFDDPVSPVAREALRERLVNALRVVLEREPTEADIERAGRSQYWTHQAARLATPAGPEERGEGLEPHPPLVEAVLRAAEEVDGAWNDEGDHIEWDSDVLPERLITLRRAYGALTDAELVATPAPDTGAEERLRAALEQSHAAVCLCPFDGNDPDCNMPSGVLIGGLLHDSASSGTREEGT